MYWAARRIFGSRRLLFFARDLAPGEAGFDGACAMPTHVAPELLRGLATVRGEDPALYAARLAAGHRLVHVAAGERAFAAFGWATIAGPARRAAPWEGQAGLWVPPGMVYLWDYFTDPAARGQGLYPRLLRHAMAAAGAMGATRAAIYCDAQNIGSAKGIAAAGFGPPAVVSWLRFGPLHIAGGERGRHTTFGAGRVPLDALLP